MAVALLGRVIEDSLCPAVLVAVAEAGAVQDVEVGLVLVQEAATSNGVKPVLEDEHRVLRAWHEQNNLMELKPGSYSANGESNRDQFIQLWNIVTWFHESSLNPQARQFLGRCIYA